MDLTAEADVRFENVTKHFQDVVAIKALNLDIPRGAFFSLLGPSGCGKTTTLRMIAGFERPTEGEVYIRGERVTDIAPYRRNFGMVFQNYALFPHMSVAQNVAFGLKMRKLSRDETARRVRETLDLVKLAGFENRYPKQLSGGQQQRVALARALVIQPTVLLLDESLSALDKLLREQMQVELRQLQRKLGITAIFVTHDQEEALTMSDHVAVMRAGVVEQVGTPGEIYERPRTEFVAGFLGNSNFVDGVVVNAGDDGARIDIGDAQIRVDGCTARLGARVKLALRPEKIDIVPDAEVGGRESVTATVREIIYRGAATHVYLERRGAPMQAYVRDASGLAPGQEVRCAWAASSMVMLREP
ncbi:MAG: ABC transporter ATP-binding protein [Burkholderiales bacterium]|nr:ABC transporter ATP-binding protein [Burkholderiales bacterium]